MNEVHRLNMRLSIRKPALKCAGFYVGAYARHEGEDSGNMSIAECRKVVSFDINL